MEIHNLAEDEVTHLINQICDEEESAREFGYCTSPECRVDAVCYVLNRTQPRYVSSARGMSHIASEQEHNTQAHIDLVALAHEALNRVSSVRRSYYDADSGSAPGEAEPDEEPGGGELPIITGRLLLATNFEPVANVTVKLCLHGETVSMVDRRWDNPYEITPNTAGQYSFWPKAPSSASGSPTVEFLLAVDDPRFEPFRYYFTVPVVGMRGEKVGGKLERRHEHTLPDMYLIPEGPDDDNER